MSVHELALCRGGMAEKTGAFASVWGGGLQGDAANEADEADIG